ncbi:hypothetical protein [Vibrio alfacsensis]|uniref:hypothetical protein n=1 Tax=Vibrio TaxID=662 RepID=UPI0040686CB3
MKKVICTNCKSTNIENQLNTGLVNCNNCLNSEKIPFSNILDNKSNQFKHIHFTSWRFQKRTEGCYRHLKSLTCSKCQSRDTEISGHSEFYHDTDYGTGNINVTCNNCDNREDLEFEYDYIEYFEEDSFEKDLISSEDYEFDEFHHSQEILSLKENATQSCGSCFNCKGNIIARVREILTSNSKIKHYVNNGNDIEALLKLMPDGWEFLDKLELLIFSKGTIEHINYDLVKSFHPALAFIEVQSDEIIDTALEVSSEAIYWVNQPSNAQYLKAVRNCPDMISLMDHKPEYICMEAVSRKGETIKYIDNPSELVKLEAVKQDFRALEFIYDQSEYLCYRAIEQNAEALRYIKQQSNKLCYKAIEKYPRSLKYVHLQSPLLCMRAVELDGSSLQYVKEPSQALIWMAFNHKTSPAFRYQLNNLNDEVLSYLDTLGGFVMDEDPF